MLKRASHYLINFIPSLLWAGIIYLFSNQSVLPGFELSTLDFLFKKTAHITVYAILYFFLYKAFTKNHPNQPKSHFVFPFLIAFLFALSDEYHQSMVPGRTPSFRDIGFDTLGMYIAFLRIYRYL